MIRSGEIEGECSDKLEENPEGDDLDFGFSERVRGSFHLGTEHIRKQRDEGISSEDRLRMTIRLMLILLFLGFVFWFFIFR